MNRISVDKFAFATLTKITHHPTLSSHLAACFEKTAKLCHNQIPN
jgi:hypothetical protein